MADWLSDIVHLLLGPPRADVLANDAGIEVHRKGKSERVAWEEITEFWGGHVFGHDQFVITAGDRSVLFGWPDNGVTAAMRIVELKLPDFPGTWYDMMAREAPFELILWSKAERVTDT